MVSSPMAPEALAVNIDPRHRGIDRSCPQIEQAGRAGADQNDLSVNIILRDLPGQDFPSGDILRLVLMAEFEIDPATSIGGYSDVADADVVNAAGLSEGGLATRV